MQKRAARRGTRALAFLLCLLMVVTLLPAMGANAAGNLVTPEKREEIEQSGGLVLDKNLYLQSDGTYTLKLEAYATGTTTTQTIKNGTPLDIVLVIDQSGSMAYNDNGKSTNTLSDRRMEKLKDAVKSFVESISTDAKTYELDHRIALVGYASNRNAGQSSSNISGIGYNGNKTYWVNTGLYVKGSFKNYAGDSNTSSLTEQDYKDALVSVNDVNGNTTSSITTAIDSFKASGGTYTEYGMTMAQQVFANNSATYTKTDGTTGTRKRIVVLFTDGETDSGTSTVYTGADALKNTYGATVYCVGFGSSVKQDFLSNVSSNCNPSEPSYAYTPVYADDLDTNSTYYIYEYGRYYTVTYSSRYGWNDGWDTYTPKSSSSSGGTQFYVLSNANQTATKYSMTANNRDELTKIFDGIATDVQNPSTEVTLNAGAVLKDIISDDFTTTTGTTVTVSTEKGSQANKDADIVFSGAGDSKSTAALKDNTVTVTGFDYSTKYIAPSHDGEKLIVVIDKLIPNTDETNHVYSNGDAGIYENSDATAPVATFQKPYINITEVTKVLDFSMTAKIASSVLQMSKKSNTYGTFTVGQDKNLTYELGNRVANGNLVFDGVDSALFYGDYNDGSTDTTARWTKVNVIPANNVYFDDDLLDKTSDFNDRDYGYDSAITGKTNEGQEFGDQESKTFTFSGTGIDVYCTTENTSGWVRAALTDVNDNAVTDADGNSVNGIVMKNQFESGKLYNVPTISFDNLKYGTYKLTITTMTNSHYKIDGVRVYNPANVDNQTTKAIVDAAYAVDGETNAVFKEVRDILIDNESFTDGYNGTEVNGVVFIDQINGALNQSTSDVIGTYKPYGPKNEVYLAKGQGIAFKLDGFNSTTQKLMIGLSAPATGSGSVDVTNGSEYRNQSIAAATDMYYNVTPNNNGYVYIRNVGESLISVTNIKITGENSGAVAFSLDEPLLTYVATFDTLTVTQPTPDPVPTPATPNNTVSAIIHAIWSSVRESIGRLFGR